jgi:predicted short-subunit dehydrogenase-like oxidoreductase (DUF2520 family)
VRASAELAQALAGVEGLLVCVADGAIGEIAARCAELVERPGVALHASGFLGPEILGPLERAGWATGVLHPLVALAAAGDPENRLRRAWFATRGDDRALALARRLIRACAGFELSLHEGADVSARYHAAASLLAGGTVALFDAALEALAGSADRSHSRAALAALLASVAANLAALEPRDALTGPLARGAGETVRGHLAALEAAGPELAHLYRILGRRMLALASARGLGARERAELERLLG